MNNIELEIWKDIKNYEGLYQVSNMGRVKSLNYHNTKEERILKQKKDKYGYYRVVLCRNKIKKDCLVHRLVASAFLPNPNNLPQVNHRDENKQNNCASNLEFCTAKYNANYGTRNERMSKAQKGKIIPQYQKDIISKAKSIPILQFSKSGNIILRKWDSAVQAEKELNINHSSILRCCKGKLNSAGKYKWMYYEDYINRMNNYFNLALKEVS